MNAALLVLGLCPAIAMTDTVIHSVWISAGLLLVSVLSTLARRILRAVPTGDRGPADGPGLIAALCVSSVLTAGFEAGLLAVSPEASTSIGIYAPLIAVNVLAVGEPLPSGATPARSVVGAVGRGLGLGAALILIALVRETLGAGTITLFPVGAFKGTIVISALVDEPVRALGLAGGALLCLGYLAGVLQAIGGARQRAGAGGEKP